MRRASRLLTRCAPFLFLNTLFFVSATAFAQLSDLDTLLQRAHEKNLAATREWGLLLHYHDTYFSGQKSDIDGKNFFLSKFGRRNPEAELDATLTAFFTPVAKSTDTDEATCQYPARYDWLDQQLQISTVLPRVDCPRYDSWHEKLNPESLSIIFASYYMNNPASMYGHTFLRLGRGGLYGDFPLTDYTINYAAQTRTSSGLMFAILGLAGGYQGTFSTQPYYLKIQKYNNLEARDLWEYELNLSSAALDRLVKHLWELGPTSMSYYFFNKNCSYQLLPLLDVADPSLHLSDPFRFRAIPLDTLNEVLSKPGLLKNVRYRPSHLSNMLAHRAELTSYERWLARSMIISPDKKWESTLDKLPTLRQAFVLDAANDFFRYRHGFRRNPSEAEQSRERNLLLLRNKVPVLPADVNHKPVPLPPVPHVAHPTERAGVSLGASRDSTFEEYSIRAALHDLEADQTGFIPNSQLEMAHVRFRYNNKHGKGYLEEATAVRVFSLSPYDDWVQKPSWGLDFGLRNAHELDRQPHDQIYFGLGGGSGYSWNIPFLSNGVFYVMGQGDSGVGGIFNDHYRLGLGGLSGALFNVNSLWRVHLSGSYTRYGKGDVRSVNKIKLIQALQINKKLEARLTLDRQNASIESVLSANYYLGN